MAQLKDLLVSGQARFINGIFTNDTSSMQNINPSVTNTYSLGTSELQWKELNINQINLTDRLYREFKKSDELPFLIMKGNNYNNYLFKIGDEFSNSTDYQHGGYGLKYVRLGTHSEALNYLQFLTNNNGSNIAISMNQSGDVGIGDNPETDYKLYINGATYINGLTKVNGSFYHLNGDDYVDGYWETGLRGATDKIGENILYLGNNLNSNAINNAKGILRFYGKNNAYTQLHYEDVDLIANYSNLVSDHNLYLTYNSTLASSGYTLYDKTKSYAKGDFITTEDGTDYICISSTGVTGGSNWDSSKWKKINHFLYANGITGLVGTTDYWRVGGGSEKINTGYLEISTSTNNSNGTNPLYVRQYANNFEDVYTTLTLLNEQQTTILPNRLISPYIYVNAAPSFYQKGRGYKTGERFIIRTSDRNNNGDTIKQYQVLKDIDSSNTNDVSAFGTDVLSEYEKEKIIIESNSILEQPYWTILLKNTNTQLTTKAEVGINFTLGNDNKFYSNYGGISLSEIKDEAGTLTNNKLNFYIDQTNTVSITANALIPNLNHYILYGRKTSADTWIDLTEKTEAEKQNYYQEWQVQQEQTLGTETQRWNKLYIGSAPNATYGTVNVPIFWNNGTPQDIEYLDLAHGGTGGRSAAEARANLGLSAALHFVGTSQYDIVEGSSTNPRIVGYSIDPNNTADLTEKYWNTIRCSGDVIVTVNYRPVNTNNLLYLANKYYTVSSGNYTLCESTTQPANTTLYERIVSEFVWINDKDSVLFNTSAITMKLVNVPSTAYKPNTYYTYASSKYTLATGVYSTSAEYYIAQTSENEYYEADDSVTIDLYLPNKYYIISTTTSNGIPTYSLCSDEQWVQGKVYYNKFTSVEDYNNYLAQKNFLNNTDLTQWSKESGVQSTIEDDGWYKVTDTVHSTSRWGIYQDIAVSKNTSYTVSGYFKAGSRPAQVSCGSGAAFGSNLAISSTTTTDEGYFSVSFSSGSNTTIRVYLNLAPTATNDYCYFKNVTVESTKQTYINASIGYWTKLGDNRSNKLLQRDRYYIYDKALSYTDRTTWKTITSAFSMAKGRLFTTYSLYQDEEGQVSPNITTIDALTRHKTLTSSSLTDDDTDTTTFTSDTIIHLIDSSNNDYYIDLKQVVDDVMKFSSSGNLGTLSAIDKIYDITNANFLKDAAFFVSDENTTDKTDQIETYTEWKTEHSTFSLPITMKNIKMLLQDLVYIISYDNNEQMYRIGNIDDWLAAGCPTYTEQ